MGGPKTLETLKSAPLKFRAQPNPDSAGLFKNAQRFAAFNRPELSAIPDQQHPRITFPCVFPRTLGRALSFRRARHSPEIIAEISVFG